MPFVSEAQRRKFAVLRRQGKISRSTWKRWNEETGNRDLPPRKGMEALRKPR